MQVKMSEIKNPQRRSPLSHGKAKLDSSSIRERILQAAFTLFRERGFSSTSMLEIVTRARVSKRDLYALFNNKHAVLAAGISERAQQMRRPLDPPTPAPQIRDALATLLVEFGVSILKTVCHPEVLTVFRLAIAESDQEFVTLIVELLQNPEKRLAIAKRARAWACENIDWEQSVLRYEKLYQELLMTSTPSG